MRIVSANVNGIRAAVRRGMAPWLHGQVPDVLCLQEVRASDVEVGKALAECGLGDWFVAHTEGCAKGRAGVAIATRAHQLDQRFGLDGSFSDAGRWVEVDVDTPAGPLTVVSTYVHRWSDHAPVVVDYDL